MKVKSIVVSQEYIRCGLKLRIKFDSLTLVEMENLVLMKGDIVGNTNVKFVDPCNDRGSLDINIFQK